MSESETLKKALIAIRKLKAALQNADSYEPIAIIGLSCRLPCADNKTDFWELLTTGQNVITGLPESRARLLQNSNEAVSAAEMAACRGGFLTDIDLFDAYFFGITPREAMRMDPQQRLLLEVAYEALEDAGLPLEQLAGSKTGVFSSVYLSQFGAMQALQDEMDALYIPTGNATSMASNRLSYLWDLQGPSLTLDTACSSSLIALHLACMHLQTKQCNTALVAAANINFLPSFNQLLAKAKMLSPTGQCHTFAAAADGYVQGEGVGVLVLKPLAQALADQDRIYSVITASVCNQDGKTNGLTAPNGAMQEALLQSALQTARIPATQVSYVECHGTGTFLGDPIEAEALGRVYSVDRLAETPCLLGSLKTNIGHLEPAAGVMSLIKVAMSLEQQQIPPHLNFTVANPHIAFDKWRLQVATQLQAWPDAVLPRTAGVSGFGFGGTNAHVIMREMQENEKPILPAVSPTSCLFLLSAKDVSALRLLLLRWTQFVDTHDDFVLAQLCYNLQQRRSHYACRIALIVDTIEELKQAIRALLASHLENFPQDAKHYINLTTKKIASTVEHQGLEKTAWAYINHEPLTSLETLRFPHCDLPRYPWQHKSYWPAFKMNAQQTTYPFQREFLPSPLPVLQFGFEFSVTTMPEIADSFYFLHAGFYLEMLAFALETQFARSEFQLQTCRFLAPIYVAQNARVTVHLLLEKQTEDQYQVTYYSVSQGSKWVKHAQAFVDLSPPAWTMDEPIDSIKTRCIKPLTADTFFQRVTEMRMPSGPSIRWTNAYAVGPGEVLCDFIEPECARARDVFSLRLHPGFMDACVQSLFMLLPDNLLQPFIAAEISALTYRRPKPQEAIYFHGSLVNIAEDEQAFTGDFTLIHADGFPLLSCSGLRMARLNSQVEVPGTTETQRLDLSLGDAKEKIHNFLRLQVAKIFSMPAEDVDTQLSLREMGIDSLMSIVFAAAIESGLGLSFGMQEILEGPSIDEMTNALIAHLDPALTLVTPENPWIAYRTPQARPKMRLFCFPYGGSGASLYQDWQKRFSEEIEICPIQLPGREGRLKEKALVDMPQLMSVLLTHLEGAWDLPFAFFGHSFGALIAFEFARTLRLHNLPEPKHLFVSAFPDPRIPTTSLVTLIQHLEAMRISLFDLQDPVKLAGLSTAQIHALCSLFQEQGLLEYGEVLMSPEVMRVLLPIFISDMTLVKNYVYQHDFPLNLPITVFLGLQDTWVSYRDHMGWRLQTQQDCEFVEFNSGHLFVKDALVKPQIVAKIQSVMLEVTPSKPLVIQ